MHLYKDTEFKTYKNGIISHSDVSIGGSHNNEKSCQTSLAESTSMLYSIQESVGIRNICV